MDLSTDWNSPNIDIQAATTAGRCDICTQRATSRMYDLHEHPGLPTTSGFPPQRSLLSEKAGQPAYHSWHLCEACATAVMSEVARAALRTPLRVRIAVGVVAADRRPVHRMTVLDTDFWEQLPEEKMDNLLVGFVLCMFALPPLVFLLVALFVPGGAGH